MRARRLVAALGAVVSVTGFIAMDVSSGGGAGAVPVAPTVAGAFAPLTPANLLDTGTGVGAPASPVPAHGSVTFQVAGSGGVPATGAGSAALVVAAVTPSAPGFATVYAADIARPPAAALDFVPGQTIANLAVSGLSQDGKVTIYNGSGAALRL